nr:thioesterase domain-containing protein [Streptomyces sp. SID11385]
MLCFPHAGAGGAAFARWQSVFGDHPQVVPLPLPGRDTRAGEPRLTDPTALMDDLLCRAGPLTDAPYALYGHSLGALVAHHFAHEAATAGYRPPVSVVLGAVQPPHLPSPLLRHELPADDKAVLRRLVSWGLLPERAALEGEDTAGLWRRRVLPVLRDDLLLAHALRAGAAGPLDMPVLAVAGRADTLAPPGLVAQWRQYAPAGFALRTVPGGHFFVRERRLPELLARALDAAAADGCDGRPVIPQSTIAPSRPTAGGRTRKGGRRAGSAVHSDQYLHPQEPGGRRDF